jgi:hypothetical protein
MGLMIAFDDVDRQGSRALAYCWIERDIDVRRGQTAYRVGGVSAWPEAASSSLAYLRDLPADEIKIDRSFVMNLRSESDNLYIVRTIVELGRSLGFDVVAEGVESEEVAIMLARMSCPLAQGYYFSRPLPASEALGFYLRYGEEHSDTVKRVGRTP